MNSRKEVGSSLTMSEALAIARKHKSVIDCGVEYSDAFMFGVDSLNDGGDMPIVVMKSTGEVQNMVDYVASHRVDLIRTFSV